MRARVLVSALPALLAALGAASGAQAPAPRIQVGMSVRPETVTVGEPFVVRLRLRVPAGATVDFPEPPDTSGPVQALDPLVLRDTVIGGESDYVALYRMSAWDIGRLPIGLEPMLVRIAGNERRVTVASLHVTVRSVLPADTALHVPKPARPPLDIPVSNWWKWLAAIAAALVLLFLLWWWRRRSRRPRVAPVVDPLKAADDEFARIEALGLLDAGERGRYVALMIEVLRDYLARRVETPVSLTSTELLVVLRRNGTIPLQRLAPLLTEADLIKFARYQVGTDRARHLAEETKALVHEVHEATEPKPVEKEADQPERAA